jgi:membrane peptidoglycan carboxypeptidase
VPAGRAAILADRLTLEAPRLPVQTTVKTGTSSDYRNAWAVGFAARHTVGIWMGNLDQRRDGGLLRRNQAITSRDDRLRRHRGQSEPIADAGIRSTGTCGCHPSWRTQCAAL